MKRTVNGNIKKMSSLLNLLENEMNLISNKNKRIPMEKYLKNKFVFLGIASPERKLLYKNFKLTFQLNSESELIEWIELLWNQPYREYQHYAMMELEGNKRLITQQTIDVVINLILNKSWWDTVDCLASNIIGKYYIDKPDLLQQTISRWIIHENMWMNRTAILVQLKYKYLFKIVNRLFICNNIRI